MHVYNMWDDSSNKQHKESILVTSNARPWRAVAGHRGNKDDHKGADALLFVRVCAKAFLGITIGLYILNQKHLLPKPISRVVSRALFWPTLPITVAKRLNAWMTRIDDTVLMGGAPFGFAGIPDNLYQQYGVGLK